MYITKVPIALVPIYTVYFSTCTVENLLMFCAVCALQQNDPILNLRLWESYCSDKKWFVHDNQTL